MLGCVFLIPPGLSLELSDGEQGAKLAMISLLQLPTSRPVLTLHDNCCPANSICLAYMVIGKQQPFCPGSNLPGKDVLRRACQLLVSPQSLMLCLHKSGDLVMHLLEIRA